MSGRAAAELTVLLPVRNGAATIERAIRSTLRALPRSAEVLVHDDASTDGTAALLARFRDPRVRVVTSTRARGVAAGLNLLLSETVTSLVARMDADDVCLPWRFGRQLRAIATGDDVVFSTVIGFRRTPRTAITIGPPIPISSAAMPLHLLLSNPVAHSTMLARTEALRRVGGYREVPAEDYDLWLRLCAAGSRCARVAAPTILYRFHDAQVTASTAWLQRVARDPEMQTAYRTLSETVLGETPDWYVDLFAPAHDEAARTRLSRLVAALDRESASLRAPERAFLRRKARSLVRTPASPG